MQSCLVLRNDLLSRSVSFWKLMLMNARLWRDKRSEHGLHLIPWRPLATAVPKHSWLEPVGGMFTVQKSEVVITLTNAWIASSNEHNLVWEVTSLKDVQCGCIPIIAFWFYDNIFDCKGLPWVKICAPLVDVAKNDRANMIYAVLTITGSQFWPLHLKISYLLNINDLAFFINLLLPAIW